MESFRSRRARHAPAPPQEDLVVFQSSDGEPLLATDPDTGRDYAMSDRGEWEPGSRQDVKVPVMHNASALTKLTADVEVRVFPVGRSLAVEPAERPHVAVPGDRFTVHTAAMLVGRTVLYTLAGDEARAHELKSVLLLQTVCREVRVQKPRTRRLRGRGVYQNVPYSDLQAQLDGQIALTLLGREASKKAVTSPTRRTPLVSGLVPAGLVLMVGPAFSGKSTLAASLAASVAAGKNWLGEPTQGGPVIVICGERGIEMRERCRVAREELGAGLGPTVHEVTWTLSGDYAEQNFAKIRTVVGNYPGTKLLVLDTLASLTAGMAELDSSSVTKLLGHLKRLNRDFPHLTILLLHHPLKSGEGVRGHGALEGSADAVLKVSETRGSRTLTLREANSMRSGSRFTFRFEDRKGTPLVVSTGKSSLHEQRAEGAKRIDRSTTPDDLLRVFRPNDGPMSIDQLVDATGLGRTKVHELIKECSQIRRIAGKRALYRLDGESHPSETQDDDEPLA
jgi:hypothetical protein